MKRFLYTLIIFALALSTQANLGMNKPQSKLSWLGFLGLQSFVGWSAYNFYKDHYSLTNRKLYANDFGKLGINYTKTNIKNTVNDLLSEEPILDTHEQKYLDALASKWSNHLRQNSIAPLYVSYLNKSLGYGAFAESPLSKDQFIGEYTGKLKNNIQNADLNSELKASTYTWGLPNTLRVDACEAGNELRFVNHSSYHANVGTMPIKTDDQWRLIYYAKKPIEKNEQLLVDYGPGYWTKRGKPSEKAFKHFRFKKVEDGMQKWLECYS